MLGAKNMVCEDNDGFEEASNYGNRVNCKNKPRLEREEKSGYQPAPI